MALPAIAARAAGWPDDESIRHDGDLWKADLPRESGDRAGRVRHDSHIESTHGDQVKAVRVVSQNGDNKVVDMDLAGPVAR